MKLLGNCNDKTLHLKPLIKYRGGKTKELDQILSWVPDHFDRYYEPFFGGGALFFYLSPSSSVVNDLNNPLMTFYDDVAVRFSRLSKELADLEEQYRKNREIFEVRKSASPDVKVDDPNEHLYYDLRNQFNNPEDSPLLPGTLYYFINKTAYSGMVRYNKSGRFNVPYGRYKRFATRNITKEHSELLQAATRLNQDFETVLSTCNEDDFVFLDPPYDSAFSDYGNPETADGFSASDHARLRDVFFDLPCKALLVIGETKLTRNLYGSHIVQRYPKRYAVNIRNRFLSESNHILVCNGK